MTIASDERQQMTRYLLGEMSEAERAEMEQSYFADPQKFVRLTEIENDLVDDYARGQLTAAQRARFETHYLANPHLQSRTGLAQSLQDSFQPKSPLPPSVRTALAEPPASWSWLAWLARPSFALGSCALVLVLAATSWWWWRASRVLQRELLAAQVASQQQEDQRRALEIQLANERAQSAQLQNELAKKSVTDKPETANSLAFVTLALAAVTGVRAPDSAAFTRLAIPAETAQVRVQLTVPAENYSSYRLELQPVGGAIVWQRRNLKPAVKQEKALFNFTLPAHLFAQGDYLLWLKGVTAQGETDDLNQSLIRVTKQ